MEEAQRMKNASRVRKNRKTVESRKGRKLFIKDNYFFSTKAKGWEETLYFRNRVTKQTGRLRQDHPDSPLAKIDKVRRTHLFLSEKRYKYLKRWYKHEQKRNRNHLRIPKVRPCERCRTEGKYHIEFARKGKKLKWHYSRGIVKIRKNPEHLVRHALNKVCGK
jgi:hypothetical protein